MLTEAMIGYFLNSFMPSNANMLQSTEPPLIQVMICGLFGTKPLPEPVMPHCQLISVEHNIPNCMKEVA